MRLFTFLHLSGVFSRQVMSAFLRVCKLRIIFKNAINLLFGVFVIFVETKSIQLVKLFLAIIKFVCESLVTFWHLKLLKVLFFGGLL